MPLTRVTRCTQVRITHRDGGATRAGLWPQRGVRYRVDQCSSGHMRAPDATESQTEHPPRLTFSVRRERSGGRRYEQRRAPVPPRQKPGQQPGQTYRGRRRLPKLPSRRPSVDDSKHPPLSLAVATPLLRSFVARIFICISMIYRIERTLNNSLPLFTFF